MNHPNAAPHILVVEDNGEIRDLVLRLLQREGFRATGASDGKAMHKAMADGACDLILLDLMLPGEDGLSLCWTLRVTSRIPVIMLTAKGDEIDRVVGLELGADDYIAKPFSSRELVARISAVLRRAQGAGGPVHVADEEAASGGYRFDRWRLDTGRRELIRDDELRVPLSTGEYDLLLALVQRPQRVLTRDQLLDLARGRAAQAFDRSIDTQISRLRKKLEADPSDPLLIKTIWGGGYMFAADVSRL
ncbi:MAG: response regulator [Alphaproteobacteria bacterium]|nr:response regulator [Alphaproteobacteria bacterium]